MTEATFETKPSSQPVDCIPGYNIRRLTRPATDTEGRTWPAGTEYVPLAGGNAGVTVNVRNGFDAVR